MHSNAVLIRLPLVIRCLLFTSVCESLYTTCVRKCPVICARNVQIFSGKENKKEENMERPNEVQAAYATFLLHVFQAGFECTAVLNTSNRAYPWPSFVSRCHHLDSFTEAC